MARKGKGQKSWAGRMSEATHPLVDAFTTSFPIDRRLYRFDIEGSLAHCRMLAKQRIIPKRDGEQILKGLTTILAALERGTFRAQATDEDIHMAVERRLIELIGPVGGKLHTARSRNDQVALDVALFVRAHTLEAKDNLVALMKVLVERAEEHLDWRMPAYTHLQRAQPVYLSH